MSHVENIDPADVNIGLKVKARITGGDEEPYRLIFDAEGRDNND